MAAAYQLGLSGSVIRTADGVSIPADPLNSDRQKYLAWIALGNVADPAAVLPIPVPLSVSRRQYFMQGVVEGWYTQAQALALITTGTLPPSVITFVASLPVAQQFAANMYLIGESVYMRNNPLLNSMTAAGNLSSAYMDAFFIAAALL